MEATTKNIYQKLQTARIVLQNMNLKKSGKNEYAKYSYYELGDFLPAINTLFAEMGIVSQVSFDRDMAKLIIMDSGNFEGPTIVFTSPMEKAELKGCHPIQNLGAVETYQRRYLYMTALEIVEHDALDSSEPIGRPPEKAKKPVSSPAPTSDKVESFPALPEAPKAENAIISQDQFNYLVSMFEEARVDKATIMSYLKDKLKLDIKSVKYLPLIHYNQVVEDWEVPF